MTILALEFSSARRGVAVAHGDTVLAEAVEHTGVRGTNAFGLIETVLSRANLRREAVETVAVGLGPGSYTGIRAAIAVAQGWQLARGINLTGVSSLESLAAQAQAEGVFGRVNLAVDAQRGEFYVAVWEISGQQCVEISPLKIASAREIAMRQAAGEICAGPEMERSLFPSATQLAALAARRTNFLPGDQLEPIYLRETNFVKAARGRVI